MAVRFERLSDKITTLAGSPIAFLAALAIIILWAVTGPLFHFSDTWQLVINTGTTIITFLMVFIIQQSQNKDSLAMQLKLNELIASNKSASNRLIDVEDLSQEELQVLKSFYIKLNTLAKEDNDLFSSHSVDEANDAHQEKRNFTRSKKQPAEPKKQP